MSLNPLDANPLDHVKTEEEHDPHYEPVIRLTEKDQAEVKTHEEDEDVRFKMRAKLFRYDIDSSEWKEKGVGDVRLLAHKSTGKVRLVMRRDKTLKVCANHIITAEMTLQPNIGSDRSWVWRTLADMTEFGPTTETLAIRFANSDNAGQFKEAFESAQRTNHEIATAAQSTEPRREERASIFMDQPTRKQDAAETQTASLEEKETRRQEEEIRRREEEIRLREEESQKRKEEERKRNEEEERKRSEEVHDPTHPTIHAVQSMVGTETSENVYRKASQDLTESTSLSTATQDDITETEESQNSRLEELMMQRPPICLTGKVIIPNTFNAAHGGFATVYTGILENQSVAVKVLRATKNRRRPASWEQSLQRRLQREINVWAALSHPNIIELLGYTEDFGDFFSMVSTWCQHGTASDYLNMDEIISAEERLGLVQGVAYGLEHLHQLKVIHGDLKPTNVLVSDHGVAQLCDFGLVRLADWQGPAGMTTTSPYTGTERYKAPELFSTSKNRHPLASFAGDIYALGCIALEFVLSQPPYQACQDANDLRSALDDEESPASRPNSAKSGSGFEFYFWDLLEACWSWDPKERREIGEVVYALSRLVELREEA